MPRWVSGKWYRVGTGRRKPMEARHACEPDGCQSYTVRCRFTWKLLLMYVWHPHLEDGVSMDVEVDRMSKFRKIAQIRQTARFAQNLFNDKVFETNYPALYDHMTVDEDEGEKIKTCTLNLFFDQGMLKGCLRDRETDKVLFGAGTTLPGLLEALEGLLTSEAPPWRDQTPQGGTTRRKKT